MKLARGFPLARPATALALALGMIGCGAHSRSLHVGTLVADHPRVAVLPLEDLSGEVDATMAFTRMVFTEVVRAGNCEVVESGVVEEAMDSLSIRNGGSLSQGQIRALGDRLKVAYLLTGTMLESGMVQVGDGQVPIAGAALKLIEVSSSRAVWAT